jgi:hypothetical protein
MEPSSNPPAEKAPGGKALEEAQAFLQKLRSRRDKEESAKPILEVQQGGSLSGVLLAGEVALLYGEAKVGKSRAAVALLGWPKGGKAEEKEGGERSGASSREDVSRSGSWRVWAPRELRFYLYHATETRYAHLKKYAKALGAEDITENILPFNDVEELERALQAIQTLAERRGRPALVVVDSLIKLVPPQQSENEAKVMDAVMARLKRAISPPEREPLVGLLVIHHAAKGNGGPRGSGAIAANADHILRLEPRRDGEEDWGLLLYERGRGDVWREVEEILRVRVRGIRRVGPAPREAKKSKRASKGARNSYIQKAQERFGNRTFSEEELYRFLAEEGHSDPDGLISVWKSRKKLVPAENGRLHFRKK